METVAGSSGRSIICSAYSFARFSNAAEDTHEISIVFDYDINDV